MTQAPEDWVALAVVTSPHGVSGRLKLKRYTDNLSPYVKQLTKANGEAVALRVTSNNGEMSIIEVEGLKDRNEAELWRGTELGVPRAALPTIEEDDSFYIHDLIGLAAQAPDGSAIGTVENVVNYGASDILVIRDANNNELMVAFDDATVPNIDIDAGIVVCELPDILETKKPSKQSKESA